MRRGRREEEKRKQKKAAQRDGGRKMSNVISYLCLYVSENHVSEFGHKRHFLLNAPGFRVRIQFLQ